MARKNPDQTTLERQDDSAANVQNFLAETAAGPATTRARPMTTKQAKRAYLDRTKGPKMSKEERRRQELAELARIKREEQEAKKLHEKERASAKARMARDKKREKEQKEKDEKKKQGLPLVTVHPSQDMITRFFRDPPVSKKRSADGRLKNVSRIDEVEQEEGSETHAHSEAELAERDDHQSSERDCPHGRPPPGLRDYSISQVRPPEDPRNALESARSGQVGQVKSRSQRDSEATDHDAIGPSLSKESLRAGQAPASQKRRRCSNKLVASEAVSRRFLRSSGIPRPLSQLDDAPEGSQVRNTCSPKPAAASTNVVPEPPKNAGNTPETQASIAPTVQVGIAAADSMRPPSPITALPPIDHKESQKPEEQFKKPLAPRSHARKVQMLRYDTCDSPGISQNRPPTHKQPQNPAGTRTLRSSYMRRQILSKSPYKPAPTCAPTRVEQGIARQRHTEEVPVSTSRPHLSAASQHGLSGGYFGHLNLLACPGDRQALPTSTQLFVMSNFDDLFPSPSQEAREIQTPPTRTRPSPVQAVEQAPPASTQMFIMSNFEDLFPSASQEAQELDFLQTRSQPPRRVSESIPSKFDSCSDLPISTQDFLEVDWDSTADSTTPVAVEKIRNSTLKSSGEDLSIAMDMEMFGSQLLDDSNIDSIDGADVDVRSCTGRRPTMQWHASREERPTSSLEQALEMMFQCITQDF